MSVCQNCQGIMWVCESHPNKPWDRSMEGGCQCSAGMNCECNPTGAMGPNIVEIICSVDMPDAPEKRTLQ